MTLPSLNSLTSPSGDCLARLFDPDPPVWAADALAVPLAAHVAACTATSPPYWGLRDYGAGPGELGHGTLDEYVADLVAVGREVARYQRPDGVWWLNLGDTYAGSGGAGGDYRAGGRRAGRNRFRQADSGLPPGQQCGVPWRAALALQADGWLIRKAITWDKGTVRPEDPNHVRRPFDASELVFMLTRSRTYRYFPTHFVDGWGDVWHIPPERGVDHEAPMPVELARRCIELTTEPGDLVVDPFAGSGTTGRAALALGRRCALFDLDPTSEGVQP